MVLNTFLCLISSLLVPTALQHMPAKKGFILKFYKTRGPGRYTGVSQPDLTRSCLQSKLSRRLFGERFQYHHTLLGIPIRKKQNYQHTRRGLLLNLRCNQDAPHTGARRLLRQAPVGGLGAARSRLPIGPGTRRGVRACKLSLKVEKRAPSGEPGLLGSGEAAPPVWGRGDLCRAPGLFFSLKSRWWRPALRSWVLVPAQARTAAHGEDWTRIPAVSGMFLRALQLAPGSPSPEAWGR